MLPNQIHDAPAVVALLDVGSVRGATSERRSPQPRINETTSRGCLSLRRCWQCLPDKTALTIIGLVRPQCKEMRTGEGIGILGLSAALHAVLPSLGDRLSVI